LDLGLANLLLNVERPVDRLATQIQVAYERDDAALEVEGPLANVLWSGPLVDERDAQPLRQIGHLAEALGQRLEAVFERGEDGVVGQDADRRAVALARV